MSKITMDEYCDALLAVELARLETDIKGERYNDDGDGLNGINSAYKYFASGMSIKAYPVQLIKFMRLFRMHESKDYAQIVNGINLGRYDPVPLINFRTLKNRWNYIGWKYLNGIIYFQHQNNQNLNLIKEE